MNMYYFLMRFAEISATLSVPTVALNAKLKLKICVAYQLINIATNRLQAWILVTAYIKQESIQIPMFHLIIQRKSNLC